MCEIRTLIGHILSPNTTMLKKSLLFACLLLLSIPSFSQQVKALVGGTLIDGFGGTPIRNSVIIVEGERIKAIGQVGTLAIPAGAEVISTEGMSVLPGLWDMHVHLMLNGHSDYTHWDSTYIDEFDDIDSRIDQFLHFCSGVCCAVYPPAEGFCVGIGCFLDKWPRYIDRGTWNFSFLDALFNIDAGFKRSTQVSGRGHTCHQQLMG